MNVNESYMNMTRSLALASISILRSYKRPVHVHQSHILDLILTTHPCPFVAVTFITGLFDHEFLITGDTVSSSTEGITQKEIRLYDRANIDAINSEQLCFADPYFNFELRNVNEN